MIPFLNLLKIHTACLGNHDFDFGIDQLEYLRGSTQFPWLLSNVFDVYCPSMPIARADLYRIFEWQGHKIGIMGLVEQEWLATLPTIDIDDVVYVDFVQKANELSKLLRDKECDLIIALTHMRAPNDQRLAVEAEDLDLILGGHDHEYYGCRRIGKTIVAKSGTDFREFTRIVIHPGKKTTSEGVAASDSADIPQDDSGCILKVDVIRKEGHYMMPRFQGGSCVEWEWIQVTSKLFSPNRHVERIVQRYSQGMAAQMQKIIGEIGVDLETRFTCIRTSECNMGNWLTDLMRMATKADVAVINSGTIRADKLYPPGHLTMGDLFAMLPMADPLVTLSVTGTQLMAVLENSVSQYPKTEGRFLQVSGLKFKFDPSQPPGSRIIPPVKMTGIGDERDLDESASYSFCTKEYIALQGKDGFSMLPECEILRDSDLCPNLQTLARNAFTMAAMANGFKKPHNAVTVKKLDHFKKVGADSMMIRKMPSMIPAGVLSEVAIQSVSAERYQLTCYVEGRIVVTTPEDPPKITDTTPDTANT